MLCALCWSCLVHSAIAAGQWTIIISSLNSKCRVQGRGVHGNGEDWDPMGPMGFPWEWELRRGSCHQQLWIVFCSYIVAWSKGSKSVMRVALQPETEQVVLNWSKLTLITLILEKLIGLLRLKFVTTYFLRIAWCLIWVAGWELEGFGNCWMGKYGNGI